MWSGVESKEAGVSLGRAKGGLGPFTPMLSMTIITSYMTNSLNKCRPPICTTRRRASFMGRRAAGSRRRTRITGNSFSLASNICGKAKANCTKNVAITIRVGSGRVITVSVLDSSSSTTFFGHTRTIVSGVVGNRALSISAMSNTACDSQKVVDTIGGTLAKRGSDKAANRSRSNDNTTSKDSASITTIRSPSTCGSKACCKAKAKFNKALGMGIRVDNKGVASVRVVRGRSKDRCVSGTSTLVGAVVRGRDAGMSAISKTACDSIKVVRTIQGTLDRTTMDADKAAASKRTKGTKGDKGRGRSASTTAKGFPCGRKVCCKATRNCDKSISITIIVRRGSVGTVLVARASSSRTFFRHTVKIIGGMLGARDARISAISNTACDSGKVLKTVRGTLGRTRGMAGKRAVRRGTSAARLRRTVGATRTLIRRRCARTD